MRTPDQLRSELSRVFTRLYQAAQCVVDESVDPSCRDAPTDASFEELELATLEARRWIEEAAQVEVRNPCPR